ncbi:MAG: ATP-binding cassette domain-containing protein [Muribaculaceae bacterium]|nr:ATP-binding cassette domain-containing protein [Muribaculaceae bacterium]
MLEVDNLTKHYTNLKALDSVTFNVGKGEICGLLGPNGAGKTTLLRIINNLLVSDKGTVRINGEPVSLKTSCKIGYMPEERGLYEKMRVEDQIMYFGRLKGGDKRRLRNVMNEYMEIFNLTGQGKRLVKELSKGNQQKVQIIATLVHEPDLVILDEPFSGFDPINGALLKDLIARLNEKGSTIMLSSHNMGAIEEMCSTIALVNKGNLLLKGELSDIKDRYRTGKLILTTRRPISVSLLDDSGLIETIDQTEPLRGRKGYAYVIQKKEEVKNNQLLDAVSIQGEVIHFEEHLPSLNDIFLQIVNEGPEKLDLQQNNQ